MKATQFTEQVECEQGKYTFFFDEHRDNKGELTGLRLCCDRYGQTWIEDFSSIKGGSAISALFWRAVRLEAALKDANPDVLKHINNF